MTSTSIRLLASSLVLALTLSTSSVFAHGVMVDGVSADWSGRTPNGPNLGIVARSATSTGELVWLDARLDARTDFASPELAAELGTFAVTADRTNLYFLVQVGTPGALLLPPQIQIAIDVDRRPGSGQNFLAGFADTTVSNDARWEFLVQTQGFASARVLDGTFATVGAATFSAIGGTVEIAVPWALLEGPGRSIDALRFSVATFREDTATGNTVDIGGSTISNALDVVSDYGDPTTATFPNTFVEVMDGVLDYSLDVWFQRASVTGGGREPYAPLQVVRFMSNGPAPTTEWIEVRNQTPLPMDLTEFALGDEETPDGAGESMMRFPSGTLAAGGVAVVALSGADFLIAYGSSPDFEQRPTDVAVPDMSALAVWATGIPGAPGGLANAGDELLALGFGRTIVDVVTFGGNVYPGITARLAPGANRVATRSPFTADTDDCLVDFPDAPEDCGPMAGTCGTCLGCTRFACAVTAGASCDDSDLCTMGTTCSSTGICTGGTGVTCSDGNQCTTDSCVPATGCVAMPNPGALCNDGQACTTSDVCGGALGTTCAGTVSCDDGNPCTADACGSTGACTNTPTVGVACNDGNACTTSDACNAAGGCGGTTLTCPEDANPCTTASCNMATGCVLTNNTASCDDGNGCTIGDVCSAGACGGSPRICSDSNPCTADSCAAGACVFAPTVGASCNDGNACTTGDVCTAAATCMGTGACDAGVDAGAPDTGVDAGAPDTGVDAGAPDTGVDSGTTGDAGMTEDAGEDGGTTEDVGIVDLDTGTVDGGGTDVGTSDTGPSDTGPRDAGPRLDGSTADAGAPGIAGGCGCRASGSSSPAAWLGLLGLAAVLARRRRR